MRLQSVVVPSVRVASDAEPVGLPLVVLTRPQTLDVWKEQGYYYPAVGGIFFNASDDV